MSEPSDHHPIRSHRSPERLEFETDVLVIGGGPAATWAAIRARQAGADVVLADKGYCGSSGVTAAAGTGVWYVPPDPDQREKAMASREAMGGHLADRRWMRRVLDETWARIPELADWGYPFPIDDEGDQQRGSLQGPEYMKRMRRRVARAGATILDHSPVLELLVDPAGSVAGANGIRRQTGQPYTVRANAVVVATGGCAFLSGALGTNVVTGDGLLFSAEAGAHLSGMEFSNSYSLAPALTSVTKSAFYFFGSFYREDGSPIEGAGAQRGRSVIARTLLTEPVYCQIDNADAEVQAVMRRSQPNFFQPLDRLGINPFTDRFQITLLLEGTVRGTGGLRIVGDDCSTSVPGLYAAGDAATRELICGAFTGGGSHNAAWAISSGVWAGAGAADFARLVGAGGRTRRVEAVGTAGLRPTGRPGPAGEHRDIVAAVQQEITPYDRNYFRTGESLTRSLDELDRTWVRARSSLLGHGVESVKARQAAAMTATARWMYNAALARTETRGMHKRDDRCELDPAQQHRLLVGGLDEVWTAVDEARLHQEGGLLAGATA
jgi:succinate dehydrogenase/fumarate reductase flavoprotein subunit